MLTSDITNIQQEREIINKNVVKKKEKGYVKHQQQMIHTAKSSAYGIIIFQYKTLVMERQNSQSIELPFNFEITR